MPDHDLDNHANQCNPNNDAYWESRGYEERPDDWEERVWGPLGDGDDGDDWMADFDQQYTP